MEMTYFQEALKKTLREERGLIKEK